MVDTRERVCFTKAEEELLARGWPRQAKLVDGHPHDKNPAKSALAYVGAIDPKYHAEWPREVAHRVLRAGPIVQFAKSAHGSALTKKTTDAVETAGAPSAADVTSALAAWVCALDEHTYEFKVHEAVYLAEAIAGTDATLAAMAEGFERAKPKTTRTNGTPMESYVKTYAAGTIGFLLLRASDAAKRALLPRFVAEHARFDALAKKNDDWAWCAQHFDMSLNGSAALKRMAAGGWRTDLTTTEYAHDDPDFVRACVASEPKQVMSVRLVQLGGLATMKDLAKRKFSSAELAPAMRDFGMIRAPETVELALSLIGKSSAKDAPIRWLVAHADYARPIVERAAKAGSAAAKAALAQMRRPPS